MQQPDAVSARTWWYCCCSSSLLRAQQLSQHHQVLLCRCSAEKRVHLSLLANPSHLEAVDPIVLGKVHPCQQQPRHLRSSSHPGFHWSRCPMLASVEPWSPPHHGFEAAR